MRICILSMQRVHNFGSVLQGYALKTILEELGHEVSFIDIEKCQEEDKLLADYRKKFTAEYALKGKKALLSKINRYTLNKLVNRSKNRKQRRLISNFQEEILGLDESNNLKQYDCCVIGSDEVFNALNSTEWGFTSQLFGNINQAKRVVTYAASCGFTSYEELPGPAAEVIKNGLKRITGFSVRDENTYQFVQKMVGIPSEINYDPVVIADFSKETRREALVANLPERYCLVYAYHHRINRPEEIKAIQALCKKEGLKLVSVAGSQQWIRNHLVVTPFQIPEVFSKAQFVVTDTFHGTIFAAKYAHKMAVFVRDSNENKLKDLLKKLEIEEFRVVLGSQLEEVFAKEHSLERMHEIERREREKSIAYLCNVLKKEE